jgi:UDP-N-acetylmuramate--alanine ligase
MLVGAPLTPIEDRQELVGRRVHLLGAGGSGMRSLAHVLAARGARLSAADANPEALDASLEACCQAGVTKHALLPLETPDELIVTDAISSQHPVLLEARRRQIDVVRYPAALGRLLAGQHGIAVAGTHGKSTTTALLGHLLSQAGWDPTVVVGASPIGQSSGGRDGCGEHVVIEACEYRRNFWQLAPRTALLLDIEADHFDCFRDRDEVLAAFMGFAERMPSDGLLLLACQRDARELLERCAPCRTVSVSDDATADWHVSRQLRDGGRYAAWLRPKLGPELLIAPDLPGAHNLDNAVAAAVTAAELGVPGELVAAGVAAFRGVHRRLEVLGTWRGVTVVDDYAHHPTAVRRTIDALRRMYPGRRLWCVFEPHQISRTEALLGEFAASLGRADGVCVLPVFLARELNDSAAGGEEIAENRAATLAQSLRDRIRWGRTPVVTWQGSPGEGAAIEESWRPGDVIVTMGAGNVRKVTDGLIDRLRRDRATA